MDEQYISPNTPPTQTPVQTPTQSEPPQQRPTGLPSATAILGQAWAVYRNRLWTFIGIMIIPALVFMGLSAAVAGAGVLGLVLLSSKLAVGGIWLLMLLIVVFAVILFIIQTWLQTALLYAIKDSPEKIGIIESYRRGWRKILSYWWISFLTGFIITGGYLLFLIPGILFSIWFSLAVFVLISEDLRGMDALLKSREYVSGKWWGVLGRLLFIAILSIIIYLIPQAIFYFVDIPFVGGIVNFVIGLLLPPLTITYMFLIYENIRVTKGEIAFSPTKGQKAKFIIVGILGILVIPILLFSSLFNLWKNTGPMPFSQSFDSNNAVLNDDIQETIRRADEAKIKYLLSEIRASAEIYWDNNGNNYGTPVNRDCSAGMFGDPQLALNTDLYIYLKGVNMVCNSDGSDYAVSATLFGAPESFVNTGDNWCVDSSGSARAIDGPLAPGEVKCPE